MTLFQASVAEHSRVRGMWCRDEDALGMVMYFQLGEVAGGCLQGNRGPTTVDIIVCQLDRHPPTLCSSVKNQESACQEEVMVTGWVKSKPFTQESTDCVPQVKMKFCELLRLLILT